MAGRRVAFFSTAPAAIHDRLREHLEREHGAEVVLVSGNLADRDALLEELDSPAAAAAEVFLTEIKAAAIDVVAEAADTRGVPVVFANNEVAPAPGRGRPRRGRHRPGRRRRRREGGRVSSDRRPPEALVSEDVRLPYSKGLMAKTLMGTGIRPERAYELARLIEGELVRGHEDEAVGAERLYDVAASVLADHEGEDAVLLLRRLQALRELDLPIVLLVGGATGTGKSTLATEIAHRLGITRVTSTDTVRQTMRAFFSQKFMPSIHYSSFEAGPAVRSTKARRPTRRSSVSRSRRGTCSSASRR